MARNNYKDKKKVGDFIFNCHQCGMPCWFSKITKLSVETGKGGLQVCPECVDAVDYSLIPWKVGAEKSIPIANPPSATVTNGRNPITDFTNFSPLSGEFPE